MPCGPVLHGQACHVVEYWLGKHAHRSGKHAMWGMGKHAHRYRKHALWQSAGWVSMPSDQASMPCERVLDGQAYHVMEGRWVSMPTDQASMPCGGVLVG